MQCDEKKVMELALGRLEGPEQSQVQAHIASCESCRNDWRETVWLVESMRGRRDEIDGGHVNPQILYEYSLDPEAFGPTKRRWIESHVGSCGECRADLNAVRELHGVSVTPEKPARSVPRWLSDLLRPRVLVPAALAAIVLIAVTLERTARNPIRPLATGADINGVTVIELPLSLLTRFTEADTAITVHTSDTPDAVLSVDLRHVDGLAGRYSIDVSNADGATILAEDIPRAAVDAGRYLMRARWSKLPADRYRVEIRAHDNGDAEVVGEVLFAIRH